MIDKTALADLVARAKLEVEDGFLPSVQIAVAIDGEIVLDETFGADPESRYIPFSCSKALTNAALWQLLGEGQLDPTSPVAEYVPSFATNGKEVVTVEQVLMHTGGFPTAPIGPPHWGERSWRQQQFSKWRLTLEPATTYVYHPNSGHWVLAEILETLDAKPYADAIQDRVTDPLGLPRLLAIESQEHFMAACAVGEPPTPAEVKEVLGFELDVTQFMPPDVAISALLTLNSPEARAVGDPGGGAVLRAADLALLYQGFLHNPGELWKPDALHAATAVVRNSLPDFFGVPANRTAGGMVIAGADGQAHRRGFGHTVSPRSFGHNGAGGQIAFADPDSGISFAYITNGLDENVLRVYRRTSSIASKVGPLS